MKEMASQVRYAVREQTHQVAAGGWLNDTSASGLSFLVASEHRPPVGDRVEVLSKATGDNETARVLRLENLEGNLTLVACKKDSAPPGPGTRVTAKGYPSSPRTQQPLMAVQQKRMAA